jgi:5'(3')-deoxyribonucleotidase
MKTILCDVDGVLADCVGALCKEIPGLTPERVKHWDLSLSMSKEDHDKAMAAMARPGFCEGLSWYEGAQNFVTRLQARSTVYALTSPFGSDTWETERKRWLSPTIGRHFVLSVPTSAKPLVRGDILIEDHPGTAYRWLLANPGSRAVLIDRPWNQHTAVEFQHHNNMYRFESYEEALKWAEFW